MAKRKVVLDDDEIEEVETDEEVPTDDETEVVEEETPSKLGGPKIVALRDALEKSIAHDNPHSMHVSVFRALLDTLPSVKKKVVTVQPKRLKR